MAAFLLAKASEYSTPPVGVTVALRVFNEGAGVSEQGGSKSQKAKKQKAEAKKEARRSKKKQEKEK